MTRQHVIQQLHNQQQSFVTLRRASLMFRSLHGHPQGHLEQRNIIMADSVKNVHTWSQKFNGFN